CHLRSDGTLPDQFVEPLLVSVSRGLCLRKVRRADGFVRLLSAFVFSSELPGLMILCSEGVFDGGLGGSHRILRQVGAVGTHVRDLTGFVQLLSDRHGLRDREVELSRSFLLQGRSGKGSSRGLFGRLFLEIGYGKIRLQALLEEVFCLCFGVKFLGKFGLEGLSLDFEDRRDPKRRFGLVSFDLPLSFY